MTGPDFSKTQTIYNLSDFNTKRERRRLRKQLNNNLSGNTWFFDGNTFKTAKDLFGMDDGSNVNRYTLRRKWNEANTNWKETKNNYNETDPITEKDSYINYIIGQHNKGQETLVSKWTPKKTNKSTSTVTTVESTTPATDQFHIFTAPDGSSVDYMNPYTYQLYTNYNFNNLMNMFQRYPFLQRIQYSQQGGTLQQQQSELDQDEQIILLGTLGYIGANPDKTAQESLMTVAQAYMQDPQSLSELVQDEELIKKGASVLEQKEPGLLEQLQQPGAIKSIVAQIAKQQQVRAARHGAQLNYIKQLKNICPEGYELTFMKKGGAMCPICNKVHKAQSVKQGKKVEKDCGGTKVMAGIKQALKCGGKVKKKEEGGNLNGYTEDQKMGRVPVKTVNGVKYFLNGDGKVVPDPKGKGSATPEMRDSLIREFNKKPTPELLKKIQLANRVLAGKEGENPGGIKISQEALKKIGK